MYNSHKHMCVELGVSSGVHKLCQSNYATHGRGEGARVATAKACTIKTSTCALRMG